ncbi:MAG: cupin domain-containing protein [Acidobacteria bacterium]|nr:MAG: cupin domain-containing protein [Acidobacteriota bacterium]
MAEQLRSRGRLALALAASAIFVWLLVGQQSPTAAAQTNFVGGAPSRPDSSDIRALRLRFEPGSRSNWHSHSNWQIIAAEEGRGRTQVRGGPMQEMLPGESPIFAGPGVVHWHGAAPDEYVVQLTFISGQATWHAPVSDEDYLGR